jgi:hypothetical protein
MAEAVEEKSEVEREIERARDNVGIHIDELDRKLRRQLDVKTIASEHAPQLAIGGAVVGFLAGFGLPKPLRMLIKIGVPLAVIAMKVKKARDAKNEFNPS